MIDLLQLVGKETLDDATVSIMPWVLTSVGAAFAAMSSVVVVLFKLKEAASAREVALLSQQVVALETRADDCERDRLQLHKTVAEQTARLAILENK